MRWWSLGLAAAGIAYAAGCSAVQEVWLKPGYDAKSPEAVKRIAIVAEPAAGHEGLAELLSQVATDRVKLKMNYLVYRSGVQAEPWAAGCTAAPNEGAHPLEGVLSLRAVNVHIAEKVELHLVAELFRCGDQELLWRAVGLEGNAAANEDLAALTEGYIQNIGEHIQPYAAPAFLVLRDMLDQLPDVVLSDDEVMEKIELSQLHPSRARVTQLASRAP